MPPVWLHGLSNLRCWDSSWTQTLTSSSPPCQLFTRCHVKKTCAFGSNRSCQLRWSRFLKKPARRWSTSWDICRSKSWQWGISRQGTWILSSKAFTASGKTLPVVALGAPFVVPLWYPVAIGMEVCLPAFSAMNYTTEKNGVLAMFAELQSAKNTACLLRGAWWDSYK